MSTENSTRESIPIALIREAIENTLGIPGFDNLVSLSITSMAHDGRGTNGQVNVIRFGKHGMYGETYAIDRSTVTCPQCHQEIGRPHTEYCSLQLGEIWDGVLPENLEYPGQPARAVNLEALPLGTIIRGRVSRWSGAINWPADTRNVVMQLRDNGMWEALDDDPAAPFIVGSLTYDAIQVLEVLRVGGEKTSGWVIDQADDTPESVAEALAAATSFVDNGCRCPNPERHTPGCPALPHTFIETADYDANNTAAGPNEPYCWTCGAGTDDPRHATC